MASPEDNAFAFNPSKEKLEEEATSFSFNPAENIPSKPKKEEPAGKPNNAFSFNPAKPTEGPGSPLDDTEKGAALQEGFHKRNAEAGQNRDGTFSTGEEISSETSFDALKPNWASYPLRTEKSETEEDGEDNFIMGEEISSEEEYDPNTKREGGNFVMGKEVTSEEEYDPDAPYLEQYPSEKAEEQEESAENAEGVQAALEAMKQETDAELAEKEKEGWSTARKIGEWWKDKPTWIKRGLSAAIIGGGILVTATGVGAIALPGLTLAGGAVRVLSGSAMYATLEGAFEKHAKKKGEGTDARSTAKKNFHTLLAAGGGVLAGGLIGRLFDGFDGFNGFGAGTAGETAGEAAADANVAEELTRADGTIGAETAAQAASESGLLGDTTQIEIKSGDTVWGILEEKLSNQPTFNAMGTEQQTHVVDALKDDIVEIAKTDPNQLQTMGIKSGDPDMIFPGDTLDLSSVLNDGNVNTAYQDALNLSQAEIDSIAQNLQNK